MSALQLVTTNACRLMETRTCPPAGPCSGPCARFESDDPTPWLHSVFSALGTAGRTEVALILDSLKVAN